MSRFPVYVKYGFKNNFSFCSYIVLLLIVYPILVFALPQFKDFQNYINYVERSHILLGNFIVLVINGSPSAVLAEPLWAAVLQVLKLLFAPPVVLGIIVGLSLVTLTLGISRVNKKPWLTLLLVLILYPLATKYFMQFRQGFAIGLYLWAYSMKGKKAIILRSLTPMIHISLFLLIAVEAVYVVFRKLRLSKRLLITFSSSTAIVVVLAIPILVSLAGAKEFVSETWNLNAPAISGFGAMLWASYGLAFFLLSKPSKEAALGITGILVFVFSQFYIDIGSRFIPIFLPFIIASQFYITKKKLILIYLTIIFGLILWLPTFLNPGRVFVN